MLSTYDISTDWIGDPYNNGDSPGLVATSRYSTGVMTDDGPVGGAAAAAGKASMQAQAQPGDWVTGLITAGLIVLVIMLLVHHFGEPKDDFKNPKASAYTVAISAASATAVIPLFKIMTAWLASTKLPLTAGLNTYVQAA